jgi:hypothetical protein
MNQSSLLSGPFVAFLILLTSAGYVFGAYVLYRIGTKFSIGSFSDYCIPIYNYVLLCRCAGISPWFLWLLLVPVVDLGFIVYLWGTLANRLSHDFWPFGLGMFAFGIPALVLAFDDSAPVDKPGTGTIALPSISCISGEYSGNSLPVDRGGIIIGRSPDKSNLVLSSMEISAEHARVWSDIDGCVWVEDLNSSNGTYYHQPQPGAAPEWIEIKDAVALPSGTHFRLGEGVIEFVVSQW